MKVAACQVPDVRSDPQRALAIVREYTTRAQNLGAGLVVFPECFLQGYEVTADHVARTAVDLCSAEFDHLLRELAGFEPVIVLGLIEKDAHAFYNAAVVIEHGRLLLRYRKMNLLDSERRVFDAGRDLHLFEVEGVKVGVNICYDLRFAASAALAAQAGAKVLVCPCNNMLRRPTAEDWKHRHNEIRSQRARESRLWLVSSDVTGETETRISYGPTAVIAPSGVIVAQVPLLTEDIVIADLSSAAIAGRIVRSNDSGQDATQQEVATDDAAQGAS